MRIPENSINGIYNEFNAGWVNGMLFYNRIMVFPAIAYGLWTICTVAS